MDYFEYDAEPRERIEPTAPYTPEPIITAPASVATPSVTPEVVSATASDLVASIAASQGVAPVASVSSVPSTPVSAVQQAINRGVTFTPEQLDQLLNLNIEYDNAFAQANRNASRYNLPELSNSNRDYAIALANSRADIYNRSSRSAARDAAIRDAAGTNPRSGLGGGGTGYSGRTPSTAADRDTLPRSPGAASRAAQTKQNNLKALWDLVPILFGAKTDNQLRQEGLVGLLRGWFKDDPKGLQEAQGIIKSFDPSFSIQPLTSDDGDYFNPIQPVDPLAPIDPTLPTLYTLPEDSDDGGEESVEDEGIEDDGGYADWLAGGDGYEGE
jgi:hypothetical protein